MSSISSSSDHIQNEVSFLQKNGFFLSTDHINDIRHDLHHHQIWSEVFWRRRDRHANRTDPELPFILKHDSVSILEVGAGYGRVLKKLTELPSSPTTLKQLTGIDICAHFEFYFDLYRTQFPSLNLCNMIYDDFFTSPKLDNQTFDMILLPMNTFPSFPFSSLELLFSRVKRLLNPNGIWLFSYPKLPLNDDLFEFVNRREGYSGELLVEQGKGSIAIEYYTLRAIKTDSGFQTATYMCSNTLTREYKLVLREIFRLTREYILPDDLHKLIEKYGFSLSFLDESSHSRVYGIIPSE